MLAKQSSRPLFCLTHSTQKVELFSKIYLPTLDIFPRLYYTVLHKELS